MSHPHLVPSAPSQAGSVLVVGGGMARIDKTFPPNDCSLCILAPKLVEAGRDANIDILTWAELVSLTGFKEESQALTLTVGAVVLANGGRP